MFFFNLLRFKSFVLFELKSNSTGRSSGRITVNHRDSGSRLTFVKKAVKEVAFDCLAKVSAIFDRGLKPDLALSTSENGFFNLSIGAIGLKLGDFILNSLNPLPIQFGNTMPLKFIPVGSRVFNVSNIARTCGNSIQILRHKKDLTLCRLPSREIKWISTYILATVGVVSNAGSKFVKFFKAGQLRWSGRRPVVRGVAMNPIDHPHGGGQGKTAGGRPSVSPYAKLTKGYRTVREKLQNKYVFKPRYA